MRMATKNKWRVATTIWVNKVHKAVQYDVILSALEGEFPGDFAG